MRRALTKRAKGSQQEAAAFRLIEEVLALMERRGLVELEMEREGLRIRLKKASAVGPAQIVEQTGLAGQPAEPPTPGSAGPAAAPGPEPAVIKSPMVGTFYRSPAPDAPPFTDVGQVVEVGQVVCIIEAMKLMNEIKSEVAGQVAEVLVPHGEPVEFGQPLFLIQPSGA